MVGGFGTTGEITGNEIGWRGEQPGSPDGCGIDFEGGSDSVSVRDNFIHDSFGAGIMVFGLSDRSRNISNATIARNVFLRNGVQQTSDDHGEISFMEFGSTGNLTDNVFYASNPSPQNVLHEVRSGTLELGWTVRNNTIYSLAAVATSIADTPQISKVVYTKGGTAMVSVVSRRSPFRPTFVFYTLDGSWPMIGASATLTANLTSQNNPVMIEVPRTTTLNVRFVTEGLLPSVTVSLLVPVPLADL